MKLHLFKKAIWIAFYIFKRFYRRKSTLAGAVTTGCNQEHIVECGDVGVCCYCVVIHTIRMSYKQMFIRFVKRCIYLFFLNR